MRRNQLMDYYDVIENTTRLHHKGNASVTIKGIHQNLVIFLQSIQQVKPLNNILDLHDDLDCFPSLGKSNFLSKCRLSHDNQTFINTGIMLVTMYVFGRIRLYCDVTMQLIIIYIIA